MTPTPPNRNCTTCLMMSGEGRSPRRQPAVAVVSDSAGMMRYACAECAAQATKNGESVLSMQAFWETALVKDAEERLES